MQIEILINSSTRESSLQEATEIASLCRDRVWAWEFITQELTITPKVLRKGEEYYSTCLN